MTTPSDVGIQPHGVLLALDDDLRVAITSANTAHLLGAPTDTVVGAHLVDVVGSDVAAIVERRVAEGYPADPLVVVLGPAVRGALGGVGVDLRVHRSGERTVVELEALQVGAGPAVSYRSARTAMARLSRATSLAGLVSMLAAEVRDVTGFDRVMVHRFDEDGDGEMVAEAKDDHLDPYLGLHYPADDLPPDARRRLVLDPVRLVAEVGATPVPLVPPLDPATGAALDLSHASLRSVTASDVEYLSTMAVTASMTVAVVVDDELWGLVVGHHHHGAHRPSQDARSAAEFVTTVASHLVAHRDRADARDSAIDTQAELTGLCARLSAGDGDPLDALFLDPALLTMLGATGAAQFFGGVLRTAGTVPSLEVMDRVAALLNDPDLYQTSSDHLAALDPALAEVADIASGALRVGTMADQWGLWFRPERPPVADWGGVGVDEHVLDQRLLEAEGPDVRHSPRRSFDRWRRLTRGHSERWEPWHREAAEELGRHINSLLLLRSREQIAMAESMQRNVVLDRAPGFAGIELVARYRPASSYQLGGDWWDAFELGPGRIVFVVGDVAGHGVAAASAMTQVRTALRAYLFEGHSPAQCLDRLDRLMDGLLDFGIATAIVAVLDVATGHLEIANAGHPAPLVVGATGGAVELEMDVRPLLGVGQGEAPTIEVDLAVGDLFVLFTDGLVERRGTDLSEGTDRLRQLAGLRPDGEDVDAWADRLLAVLDTADDDTTLLAVRRLG